MRGIYLYVYMFLLKACDSVTTYLVLSRGGYEVNPLMAFMMSVSPLLFYIVTPFVFATLICLLFRLSRRASTKGGLTYPDAILLFPIVLIMGLVIASNLFAYLSAL